MFFQLFTYCDVLPIFDVFLEKDAVSVFNVDNSFFHGKATLKILHFQTTSKQKMGN